MTDPRRFLYTDAQGRNVLGFRTRRGSGGEVYAGFEDVFRGPEDMIRDRFRAYLPLLKRHDAVVDIGCGRGELLDLLRTEGVPAVGVERDEAMVHRCRARGHVVEQTDGLSYLRAQPEASLSAIVATQVVEHLPYDDLMSLLALSRSRLKAGGQLIFETVNPHALEAFKTFWTDLTHERPIFPEVAVVLCWLLDFDQAHVFFPNGVGDEARDRMTCGEYAVVATKNGDD
jgi:SAM-dependent methyltransferase